MMRKEKAAVTSRIEEILNFFNRDAIVIKRHEGDDVIKKDEIPAMSEVDYLEKIRGPFNLMVISTMIGAEVVELKKPDKHGNHYKFRFNYPIPGPGQTARLLNIVQKFINEIEELRSNTEAESDDMEPAEEIWTYDPEKKWTADALDIEIFGNGSEDSGAMHKYLQTSDFAIIAQIGELVRSKRNVKIAAAAIAGTLSLVGGAFAVSAVMSRKSKSNAEGETSSSEDMDPDIVIGDVDGTIVDMPMDDVPADAFIGISPADYIF